MHSPAMEEWLWWLKFCSALAAFAGTITGALVWFLHRLLKKLDERTENIVKEVFREMAKALFGYFNEQLVERDNRILTITERVDKHDFQLETFRQEFRQSISWQNSRITQIGIAGSTLAAISLYPTPSPSKRERDRVIDDWRKIIGTEVEPKGD